MSSPIKCAGCKNPLPKKDHLKCSVCKAKYDLECANVTNKMFTLMERKEHWKCPECTNKRPKKGNINTPVRNTVAPLEGMEEQEPLIVLKETDGSQNVTCRAKNKRSKLDSNKNSARENDQDETATGCPTNASIDDLKFYMRELLHSQTETLREAINDLSLTIKSQNARIEQLESRVTVLESKLEEAQQPTSSAIEGVVAQLQLDIQERDQALLANDLEIAGCTEVASENCTHIALSVANKIGLELDERDIVSAERVGPVKTAKEDGVPARTRIIAVRLARRVTKNAMLQAARTRRQLNSAGLNLPEPLRPIYINERLTRHNRILFTKARALARDLKYKYVWTREGKVFVRQEDGKPRHRICSNEDLLRVFGKSDV